MRSNGQRKWLEAHGYLAGNTELLAKGKTLWKRQYQREYQKQRRKQMKYVDVALHPNEANQLRESAAKHHQGLTTYLREAALAYDENRFMLPDDSQLIELREELAFIRYNLEEIKREALKSYGQEKQQQFDLALDRISYLDGYIQAALSHPPLAPNQS